MDKFDMSIEYFNELKSSNEYKRLIELKNIIDNKYTKLIIAFKTLESKYNDILKYNDEKSINETKKRLIEAKANLYSKEEIKEYFNIKNELDKKLKKDFEEIKESISIDLTKKNKCK